MTPSPAPNKPSVSEEGFRERFIAWARRLVLKAVAHGERGPAWWRRFWSQMIDSLMGQILLRGVLLRRTVPLRIGDAHHEFPDLFSGQHARFFAPLPAACTWTEAPVEEPPGRSQGLKVRDLTAPSATPVGDVINDVIRARRWTPKTGDRGLTVVGIDGIVQIGAGWFRRFAERVGPLGIETVMMDAPFNFRRTPGPALPGQLIVGGDLSHQLSVARQSVLDITQLCRSLQAEGRRVGLVGCSYGGWLMLMAATVVDDLDFVISLAPPADIVDLLQSRSPFVKALRRGLQLTPVPLAELEALVRPVRPREWRSKLPGRQIRLHAARYDRFVPNTAIEQLAKAWQAPLVWHDEAHYRLTVLESVQTSVIQEIQDFWPAHAAR